MTMTLVATSHGTGVHAARCAVRALVAAVGEASPHLDVREAFVDVQRPRVDTVVDSVGGLAVVVPLLLTPGFHVRIDIQRAADRPWVAAARPLGTDKRIIELLHRRLVASGATSDDVVVLGAAGSTDAAALQSVDTTAQMLGAAWGAPIPVGYLGGKGTPIEELIAAVSRTGRRVVIASHLLAPGYFYDRLLASGADVVSGPLLSGSTVDPAMVSLVLDRFSDAAQTLDRAAAPQRSHSFCR